MGTLKSLIFPTVSGILLIVGFTLLIILGTSSQETIDRQDCARREQSKQTQVIVNRDTLGWKALQAFAFYGQVGLEEYRDELRRANERVDSLPNLQDIVDERC